MLTNQHLAAHTVCQVLPIVFRLTSATKFSLWHAGRGGFCGGRVGWSALLDRSVSWLTTNYNPRLG